MRLKAFVAALALGLALLCDGGIARAQSTINIGQPRTNSDLNSLVVRQLATAAASDINGILGMHPVTSLAQCPSPAVVGMDCRVIGSPDIWYKWSGSTAGWTQFATINETTGAVSFSLAPGNIIPVAPITAAFAGGAATISCPTCGITTSPLSQFAATTSAQLAGVISDETGSGKLVFATGASMSALTVTSSFTATGLVTAADLFGTTGGGNVVLATGATMSSLTVNTAFTATGLVGLPSLASQSANTIVGATAAGSPVALAVPSCVGAANALQWTSGTGFNCQAITAAAGSIAIGTTSITSGTSGRILYDNSAVIGELSVTGSAGSVVLSSAPTIASPNFTGTVTGNGTIPNAVLVNSAITINSTSCALGASCTITATAASVTVGTTAVNSGTNLFILYNNAGTLGNLGTSGTGNVVLVNGPTIASLTVTTAFNATGLVTNADLVNSATTVNGVTCTLGSSCTAAAAAGTLTGTALNSTVVSSALTSLGTIATGVWQGTIVSPTYGGTGVNNGSNTITLAASLTQAGAFATTITVTAITNSTLPAGTHTLAGLDVTQTYSAVQSFNSGDFAIKGSASGALTVNCAATCGTNTLTLPAGTTDFSSTGGASQVVKQTSAGGAFTVAQLAFTDISGTLSMSAGGTGASLTASAGGIVYVTGSAMAVLAGTSTSGQCLLSGNLAAPTWGSCSGAAAVSNVSNVDGTLTISPTTGSVVASLNLSHANTISAVWTFGNSDIALLGSSTGKTTFTSANSSATNYTLTVPAVTDTIAVLGTAQTFTGALTLTGGVTIQTNSLSVSSGATFTGGITVSGGSTIGGFTANGGVNFTSTFQINGNTMTFPGAAATVTQTVASGTLSLGTSAIASGACATAVTATATGALTTDSPTFDFNGDPTGVTGYAPSSSGMLTIIVYPTSGNVNAKVCNNTGSSITPGAITLNYRLTR